MRIYRTAVLVAGLAATATPGLAAAPSPSEGFAFSTYEQQADGITVLVDSFPASLHDRDGFIPLHVAIGVQGRHEPVTFTAESFTLIDRDGHSYPMASYQQIVRDYGEMTFDRSLVLSRPLLVGSRFVANQEISANFFPSVGLANDTVHLGSFTWFHDLLYFPRPEAGLGGVLQLRVTGKGIAQPIVVGFEVPLKMREERDAR